MRPQRGSLYNRKLPARIKTGKKEKSGKAGIAFLRFLACPAFVTGALLAAKAGSLGMVILARTFRKYGLTVSDNDPWGMILIEKKRWDLRPTPLPV